MTTLKKQKEVLHITTYSLFTINNGIKGTEIAESADIEVLSTAKRELYKDIKTVIVANSNW